MKPQKVSALLSAGLDGDLSGWEPCPERSSDAPTRRLQLGDWFTLGAMPGGGFVLYYDDGFSMTMEVDVCDPEGRFSGPGAEAEFGAFGGRRTHIELEAEEMERLMRLTFYRDVSVLDTGMTFLLSDELGISVTQADDCFPPRFACSITYVSSDGKASVDAAGELLYLPEGPAVIGEGFRLVVPVDQMTLKAFRERNYDPAMDSRNWVRAHPFVGRPEAAAGRERELRSALARARVGSRSVRIPKGVDGGDEPWADE